jgi:hypothetical protein
MTASLIVARSAGMLAASARDPRESCPFEPGPMRDAWLDAYDASVPADLLAKVLNAGGPLQHPGSWVLREAQEVDNGGSPITYSK